MRTKLKFICWMLVSVLWGSAAARAMTYYVDASQVNDAGDGLSWATAKKSIQGAVDLAVDADVVLVTNGIYNTGGAVGPGFVLHTNRVCLTNAITVRSVNGPDVTIIEGAAGSNGSNDVDAIRPVRMIHGSLSGFTVTKGYTSSSYLDDYDRSGGGIWMTTNCVVSDCQVTENLAAFCGGGVFLYAGGRMDDCLLAGNLANEDGGGAFFSSGGAINNSQLLSNYALDDGGGAYCTGGGLLNNCLLIGNHSPELGGGARLYAGGVMNNCVAYANTANLGGGVYASEGGTLNNCTLWVNLATIQGGGAGLLDGGIVNNCIFIDNIAASIMSDIYQSGTNTVRYTRAANGIVHGVNHCTTNDPLFVDSGAMNFSLRANSPCINAGNNLYAPTNAVPYDYMKKARIKFGTVDMGACEYQGGGSPGSLYLLLE